MRACPEKLREFLRGGFNVNVFSRGIGVPFNTRLDSTRQDAGCSRSLTPTVFRKPRSKIACLCVSMCVRSPPPSVYIPSVPIDVKHWTQCQYTNLEENLTRGEKTRSQPHEFPAAFFANAVLVLG